VDLLATQQTILTCEDSLPFCRVANKSISPQQVRNKSVTSWRRQKSVTCHCNGIWETTQHNRHNGFLPAPTCYRLVTDLW